MDRVQKSVGRILYNDFLNSEPGDPAWAKMEAFRSVGHEASLEDRDLEKAFVKLSQDNGLFAEKTDPTVRPTGTCSLASHFFIQI